MITIWVLAGTLVYIAYGLSTSKETKEKYKELIDRRAFGPLIFDYLFVVAIWPAFLGLWLLNYLFEKGYL